MLTETVELGTDRTIRWTLLEDGETVPANTVTRVQFKVAGLCFDSDTDTEVVLTDSATVVELKLGGLSVRPGFYRGYLTVFDSSSTDGLPWLKTSIRFMPWPRC